MKNSNKILKNITSGLAIAAGLLMAINGTAQTYTWADTAQGQLYLNCSGAKYYWPSNSDWTQSVVLGDNCDKTGTVESEPSNWSPEPPAGVFPGGPGLTGVDVVLGPPANTDIESATANVNSLTLQTNGGLYLGYFGGVTANTVDIQGDAVIHAGGYAGELNIADGGSLTKSGGSGALSFAKDGYGNPVSLEAINASLIIHSGSFDMPYAGGGAWFGGTFDISSNSTMILNVDGSATPYLCDTIAGTGGGTVLMTGNVEVEQTDFQGHHHNGLTLNFPGKMFQWSGGYFAGTATNIGVLNLSTNPATSTTFYNDGSMLLADGSSFTVNGFQPLNNQSDGTVDLQGDANLPGTGSFANRGLLKKSAGTGVSQVFPHFYDYCGTVEVDTGTLALNLFTGGYFTNTTFMVGNGVALDLSISNYTTKIEGTLTGSGGGTILVNNGTLASPSHPAALNFPGNMFQWAGGIIQGEDVTDPISNIGTLNVVGPVAVHNALENDAMMIQSANGSVASGGTIHNASTGIYQLQNDGSIGSSYFNNDGRLEKTGGTGTNTIGNTVNNTGTITANTGAIAFTGYFNQNAGTLTLTPAISFGTTFYLNGGTVTGTGFLGGTNVNASVEVQGGVLAPGNPFGALTVPSSSGIHFNNGATFSVVLGGPSQFNQLVVSNYVALGGTLNVTLTNDYVPAIGTQFHIISCRNMGLAFSTLNVPAGIAVTYSNTSGVYLTVTGSTPVQWQTPKISGGNVVFGFGTTNGLGYTVQQNSDLTTSNWTYFTNIIGTGSLYQFVTPVTNFPQMFFRVRQP